VLQAQRHTLDSYQCDNLKSNTQFLFLGTDLFEELVPVTVHQAMAAYEGRKTEILNTEIMKLRESTQFLNR
jgi:hypothetical protein